MATPDATAGASAQHAVEQQLSKAAEEAAVQLKMYVTQRHGSSEALESRQSAGREQFLSADVASSPPATAQPQPVPMSAQEPSHPAQPRSTALELPEGQAQTAQPLPQHSNEVPPSPGADMVCNHEPAAAPLSDATPAQPCTTPVGGAPATAGSQPAAALNVRALFTPRATPAANVIAAPRRCSFELLPGLPPVVVDVPPGVTLAEAEERAAELAGLHLSNPPRRVAADIYPDWIDLAWTRDKARNI